MKIICQVMLVFFIFVKCRVYVCCVVLLNRERKNMAGKKCYQFTEDQKFQLISAWENEEILHDSSHVDYFNSSKRWRDSDVDYYGNFACPLTATPQGYYCTHSSPPFLVTMILTIFFSFFFSFCSSIEPRLLTSPIRLPLRRPSLFVVNKHMVVNTAKLDQM